MSIPSLSYDQSPPSSSSLPSYSYKPLDIGRKEIRLIKLEASIKSQPLRGNIIHVPLTDELDYWALSYCWGSLPGKRTIILDEMKLQITVNLDDALRQLGNSYDMLWVDAICINQEDDPEKFREVSRMGEIYSSASGVGAWLGVATKTSDRAMDFLRVLEFSQYYECSMKLLSEVDLGEFRNECFALKKLPSKKDLCKFRNDWIALKDLVRNGYWSRTWIIQELALSQSLKIVHCGTKSLAWVIFGNVFGDLTISDCILRAAIPAEVPEVLSRLDNLRELSLFERALARDRSVFDILSSTNRFLATDPRAKVYGILALSAKLRQLVPHPNYALSKEVVFRDLTKAMLASGYNLDLICYKHPTHVNQSDVVSWVPRWDGRYDLLESPEFLLQALRDKHSRGAYSADAGQHAFISYVEDDSILRDRPILQVRGIFFDKVDGLGRTETPGLHFQAQDAIEPNHNENAYGSNVDTFRALERLSLRIFHVFSPNDAQNGYSLNNERLIPRVYQQLRFMDPNSLSYQIAREWLHRTEEFLSFMGRSLQQWYEMAFPHGEASPLASSSSNVQMDPELDGMLKCLMLVSGIGWRWLSTDRGYLGQTHPQTQKGDEIVIVQGCTIPMVLRPCGQHYRVVCAAYVQGIMHGEALQGVTDDQMDYFNLA